VSILRRTFVVHVHPDRKAVLEDVRNGERVRVAIRELPREIERRLASTAVLEHADVEEAREDLPAGE
jgi:hypothetical protein